MREEQEIGEREGEEEEEAIVERVHRRRKRAETRITIPFKNHSLLHPFSSRLSPSLPPSPSCAGRDRTGDRSRHPLRSPTFSLLLHLRNLPNLRQPPVEGQHLQNSGVYNNYYCPWCLSPLFFSITPRRLPPVRPPFDGRDGVVSPPTAMDRVVHGPRLPSIPSFE